MSRGKERHCKNNKGVDNPCVQREKEREKKKEYASTGKDQRGSENRRFQKKQKKKKRGVLKEASAA